MSLLVSFVAVVSQFIAPYFVRHVHGLYTLRGVAARAIRVAALCVLGLVWFMVLPVVVGAALLVLSHSSRFFPYPILGVEDVVYVWVLGFTSVQFLYRCLMIGVFGLDRPMRRALERLWVRVATRRGDCTPVSCIPFVQTGVCIAAPCICAPE